MQEQVCVSKQGALGRCSLVEYAFYGFRYLVTGIVAMLLVLLVFALES